MKNLLAVERWPRWALPLTRVAGPLTRVSGPLPRPSVLNWIFDITLTAVVLVTVMVYALEGDIGRTTDDEGRYEPSPGFDPDGPEGPLPPEPPTPPELEEVEPGWTYDLPAHDTSSTIAAALLALIATLPLALRRRFPLTVMWVVIAAAAVTPATAPRLTFYACVIAAYSAAAYSPYRLATILSMPVMYLAAGSLTGSSLPTVPNQYVPLLVIVPITIAANGLRMWKQRTEDGNARVVTLERERGEAVRRATEHERSRIARELHDVVTHNVSMMVIQAGAARKVMDNSPDQAREALLAVEAGGRAAMTELRHVMGLLTTDADTDGELSPQPGLGRLAELLAGVRDAGVTVESIVDGEPRELPSGVDLAAYRVVQEAMTNTMKHAVGASITVVVSYRPEELLVEVDDTGGTPAASAADGNGRGLIGLRERLAVYGGTLETGGTPAGGHRVTARIPLEPV